MVVYTPTISCIMRSLASSRNPAADGRGPAQARVPDQVRVRPDLLEASSGSRSLRGCQRKRSGPVLRHRLVTHQVNTLS